MIVKISAGSIKNSRGEKTIQVIVKTSQGKFVTSAPVGKSTGKYEIKSYSKSLENDINFINKLDVKKINELGIEKFEDLKWIETLVFNKIGANSLFALEASLLKALAKKNKKKLWEFLSEKKIKKLPCPVGNAVGGGLHSRGVKGKKPDFQEFLFISKCKTFKESMKINETAYKLVKKLLKAKKRNDEGAWETNKTNEEVLEILKKVKEIIRKKYNKKIEIGVDVAASSFYKDLYYYKNPNKKRSKKEQINYILNLIKKYKIFYVEDPLEENDFYGFKEILKKTKNCLIVGDDLTVTNPEKLKKAIKTKAINAVIVKPNQIGSLLEVKKVIELSKKSGIKTIISHRSGETKDTTIADLAVAWECDYIKTGIYGDVRKVKLKKLLKIEKSLF